MPAADTSAAGSLLAAVKARCRAVPGITDVLETDPASFMARPGAVPPYLVVTNPGSHEDLLTDTSRIMTTRLTFKAIGRTIAEARAIADAVQAEFLDTGIDWSGGYTLRLALGTRTRDKEPERGKAAQLLYTDTVEFTCREHQSV